MEVPCRSLRGLEFVQLSPWAAQWSSEVEFGQGMDPEMSSLAMMGLGDVCWNGGGDDKGCVEVAVDTEMCMFVHMCVCSKVYVPYCMHVFISPSLSLSLSLLSLSKHAAFLELPGFGLEFKPV